LRGPPEKKTHLGKKTRGPEISKKGTTAQRKEAHGWAGNARETECGGWGTREWASKGGTEYKPFTRLLMEFNTKNKNKLKKRNDKYF